MRGIFSGAMAPVDDELRGAFEHAAPSITRAALTPSRMCLLLLTPHLFSADLFHRPEIILALCNRAGAEHCYSPDERHSTYERCDSESSRHDTCKSPRLTSRFG